MTIEEIEQSLKTMAAGQAKLEATFQDVAQLHQQVLRNHEARQADLEESFRKVAIAIEQLKELAISTDGRLDATEESQVHTDARLDALIDAQIQSTQRFDQMAMRVETLTSNIAAVNGRVDRIDERLDQVGEHLDRLTGYVETLNSRANSTDVRLDQIAMLQAENAEQMKHTNDQIKALVAAQARTFSKPKTKAAKKARRSAKKGG